MVNECEIDFECQKHHCDLEDLTSDQMAEDEFCHECPRKLGEMYNVQSFTADEWDGEIPCNVNAARQYIITYLKTRIPRSGLISYYQSFCDIMYGEWVDGDMN